MKVARRTGLARCQARLRPDARPTRAVDCTFDTPVMMMLQYTDSLCTNPANADSDMLNYIYLKARLGPRVPMVIKSPARTTSSRRYVYQDPNGDDSTTCEDSTCLVNRSRQARRLHANGGERGDFRYLKGYCFKADRGPPVIPARPSASRMGGLGRDCAGHYAAPTLNGLAPPLPYRGCTMCACGDGVGMGLLVALIVILCCLCIGASSSLPLHQPKQQAAQKRTPRRACERGSRAHRPPLSGTTRLQQTANLLPRRSVCRVCAARWMWFGPSGACVCVGGGEGKRGGAAC